MIEAAELDLLRNALARLAAGFDSLPPFSAPFDTASAATILDEVARRMQDNYPYHHPLYAGQMLKPPHPIARVAYALSLWLNPNNHALDGGRASSAMEKECVASLGAMFGWSQPLGHLAGGGTVANLEALWIAGRERPGRKVVASSQAHYTHPRLCDVLGLPFSPVAVDASGRMAIDHLRELLSAGDVGTIVATIGSTGLGSVDPLPRILELARDAGVRVHADAAYGGYFGLTGQLGGPARDAFDALGQADSIVVDPHKHGLQPYGCGCVLFRDPSVGRFYKHESPYTYFSSADLHLGEISLECSRPGAAAVALWATHQLLPPVPGGAFAAGLEACLSAARGLYARLEASRYYLPLFEPELDILVYVPRASDTQTASRRSRRIFDLAAEQQLHLSLVQLPVELLARNLEGWSRNSATVTCLRSVLMKPEHESWLDRIMSILESAARRADA